MQIFQLYNESDAKIKNINDAPCNRYDRRSAVVITLSFFDVGQADEEEVDADFDADFDGDGYSADADDGRAERLDKHSFIKILLLSANRCFSRFGGFVDNSGLERMIAGPD